MLQSLSCFWSIIEHDRSKHTLVLHCTTHTDVNEWTVLSEDAKEPPQMDAIIFSNAGW